MLQHRIATSLVFPSALGWMAARWENGRLAALSFGHGHAADGVAWLNGPAAAEMSGAGAIIADCHVLSAEANLEHDDRTGCSSGTAVSSAITPAMRSLVARMQAYAAGEPDELLDIEIDDAPFTPFRRRVTAACRRIPYGTTVTYAELAERVGAPRAARAVGNVMRTNLWPLIVPCHRVIGSGGGLGGYSAPDGLAMKKRLLAMEAAAAAAATPVL